MPGWQVPPFEPVLARLAAQPPVRPTVAPSHPPGGHRRVREWAEALHAPTPAPYDRMGGVDFAALAAGGRAAKAPGGEAAHTGDPVRAGAR